MALFQGQASKDPIGGYPSNIKGWKKKFFFISGDDYKFSPGISKEKGVAMVPRS